MRIHITACLLPLFCLALAACTPSESESAARQAGSVKIGASTSVRINGKPLAHAASGPRAGQPLLAASCENGSALEHSPDVKINGAPVTVVKTGKAPSECRANGKLKTSANVQIDG